MRYLYGHYYSEVLDAIYADNYRIYGYGGHDDIYASDYADTISGGSGDDLIFAYDGRDRIYGDSGFDTIYGGAGNDTMSGGSGDDDLYGGSGNDKLFGDTGWDLLSGGSGHDTIEGGSGNDFIEGNGGNDVIWGGPGDDDLFGDSGFDLFEFADGDGFDVIGDFRLDQDQVYLDLAGINNFNDVKDFMYRDGGDTVLDFGSGDTLVIENILPRDLISSDFIFA